MGFLRTMAVLRFERHGNNSAPKISAFTVAWNKRIRTISGPVLYFSALLAKARRRDSGGVSPSSPGGCSALNTGTCSSPGAVEPTEPKLYLEDTVLERKIADVDLVQLVDLPTGLDLNEWLASHTIAFFEHINLLYGAVSEFCTSVSCPEMTGPGQRHYMWMDEKGKKLRLSAPQYIDYVMTYAQRTVHDESIFPTKFANEFPPTFESVVKKLLRLFFHVVAHLYHNHFRELLLLGLHSHLNCLFAHLTLLNSRFHLIEDKETQVLGDLAAALKLQSCIDSRSLQYRASTQGHITSSSNQDCGIDVRDNSHNGLLAETRH